MSAWNELIGRITRRLEVDEELRLDVARELRCHLEDAAAEFRAAGESDEQAAASATRALGEPEELAEELWQANRGRIRIRGLLRWAARVTLLPAAILVVVVLLANALAIGVSYNQMSFGRGGPAPWVRFLADPFPDAGLTEEQRFVLHGDPNAANSVDRAKSISDRWPDNPVYYGNYIVHLLVDSPVHWRLRRDEPVTREQLDELIAPLRRGEQLDPDNAFYALEIASLLIQASSNVTEDPNTTYKDVDRDGKPWQAMAYAVDISDPEMFQQGIEAFRRALAKPRITLGSMEMLRLRLDMLPAPRRMVEYLNRVGMWVSTLLPHRHDYRTLGNSLLARSLDLARSGEGDEAVRLARQVEYMGDKVGAEADFLVELLLGRGIRRSALGHMELIYTELGNPEQATAVHKRRVAAYDLWNRVMKARRLSRDEQDRTGLLESIIVPTLPDYRADLSPVRTAEHLAVVQAGLLALLADLLIAAGVLSVWTAAALFRLPKAQRPVMLFVGWRRLGRICLLAVVLPVAVYGLYSLAVATWGPHIGLAGAMIRVSMELTLLVTVVFVLLTLMSGAAIRQRAAELGMEVPPPMPWRRWIWPVGLLIGGATLLLAGVVAWWLGGFRCTTAGEALDSVLPIAAAVAILLLACLGLAWVLWAPARARRFRRLRRSVRRSMVPILAAAVIVVGIGLGGTLAVGEGYAISRMGKGLPLPDEIANSDFRLLQEHLATEERRLAGETDITSSDSSR